MIQIRHSEDRGPANHGWLQSRHSFSFAGYYDPRYMGVSALRVINDDRVAPGMGFATHSHRDMEIISYVKSGTIEHKDSMGNIERLPAGEFLQIWIQPNRYGIEPGYQQKLFDAVQGLQLIASPDARDGSLLIHQDASLYQLRLESGTSAEHALGEGRTVYVHVVSGSVSVNGAELTEGDGATIRDVDTVSFASDSSTEALVFDLP